MEETIQIPKTYASLDEAFADLPVPVQKHSIRVAEYIQVLFASAINVEMNLGDAETMMRRQTENIEGVYWSGYYHEIGLLALPESCRLSGQCKTQEQIDIHRMHVQAGLEMVKYYGVDKKDLDEFEYQMILEAIRYHHEKWDGSGYPDHLSGKEIPMTALLLACADTLDNAISREISEQAFEDAVRGLLTDESLDPEVRLVFKYCTSGLRKVFKRHMAEYQLITPPEHFVVRRTKRLMKLLYQVHPCLEDLSLQALSARPYFFDKSGTELDFEMLKSMFDARGQVEHVCSYFLFEAGDMIGRIGAYDFNIAYLSLYLLPAFMELETLPELVEEMVKKTGIDRTQLAFEIAKGEDEARSAVCVQNMKRLADAGFSIKQINAIEYAGMALKETDVDANTMIHMLVEDMKEEMEEA